MSILKAELTRKHYKKRKNVTEIGYVGAWFLHLLCQGGSSPLCQLHHYL